MRAFHIEAMLKLCVSLIDFSTLLCFAIVSPAFYGFYYWILLFFYMAGWSAFYVLFPSTIMYFFARVCPLFCFGLVHGCNFVSCLFGLNILACISIPISISSRFYMYAYPYLLCASDSVCWFYERKVIGLLFSFCYSFPIVEDAPFNIRNVNQPYLSFSDVKTIYVFWVYDIGWRSQ